MIVPHGVNSVALELVVARLNRWDAAHAAATADAVAASRERIAVAA